MAQPYVGEIRMFGGSFAPNGWLYCDGQLLSISQNETLFQLIGTTYGGDGETTFALPDLRGRIPIHQGNGVILAERGGVESVTLTVNQLPAHTHSLSGSASATSPSPAGAMPAAVTAGARYYTGVSDDLETMTNSTPVGGNQPHDNMAPFTCVAFIISLFGIFPSPT